MSVFPLFRLLHPPGFQASHISNHAHTYGATRPADVPFPCRYHKAPIHHQRRLPRFSYHGTSLEPSRRRAIKKILTKKERALSSTGTPVSLV